MKREPVESSNIVSIGYDSAGRVLEVEFKNGGVWQYPGVPPEDHSDLMKAPSIGKHFHAHIKAHYQGHRQ